MAANKANTVVYNNSNCLVVRSPNCY